MLRPKKSETFVNTVPTQAMRNGDLSGYLTAANGGSANLLNGYPTNQIPASMLNPYAQKLMNTSSTRYRTTVAPAPLPITTLERMRFLSTVLKATYVSIRALGPKHMIFVRWTYKNRRITLPQEDQYTNPSSPLLGSVSTPQIYNSLATSYNWVISPSVVNELRGGFSVVHRNTTFGLTAQQAASILGLTVGPGALPEAAPAGDYDTPTLNHLAGFMGFQDPV